MSSYSFYERFMKDMGKASSSTNDISSDTSHYENTPLQHTAIFHICKNDILRLNFFFTIFIFLLKTKIVGTR